MKWVKHCILKTEVLLQIRRVGNLKDPLYVAHRHICTTTPLMSLDCQVGVAGVYMG